MLRSRHQALIDAPVREVYDMVSDPNRHPEWWPTMVEAECEELTEGCQYRGVVKGPFGKAEEHELTLDRLDDCHEVTIRCEGTGVWNRWVFTEAQGKTFVDAEFGAEPQSFGMKVFEKTVGKRFLSRWVEQSVDALEEAATGKPAAKTGS